MRVKKVFFSVFVGIFVLNAVSVAAPTKTISGVVATANGIGVEGVNVVGDNGATSAITAADGAYSITIPNNWTGTITASKAGWLITPASRSYNAQKVDLTGENFLAYQPKISGYVKKSDGTPLAGATVTANNAGGPDTTDASGYYEFYIPYNWSGAVSATLAGYYFADKTYTNLITDQTSQDFSGYQPTISGSTNVASAILTVSGVGVITSTPDYTVTVPYGWSGTITAELANYDFTNSPLSYTNVTTDLINQNFTPFQPMISGSTGIAGATVTISGVGSVVSTPEYSVVIPYGWSGTVEASLTDYGFSESPRSYTNVTTDQVNQNFTPFQPTISGSTGVAGATVTVSGVDSVVSTPEYSIIVPYSWSGTIEASLAGYDFPESPRSYTDVIADQANQNFTSYQKPKISGAVTQEDGTPVAGVTITADNGSGLATTDAGGYFEIIVPYNWSGQVTAEKIKWDITPESYSYVNVISDQRNQDFSATYISTIIVKADGTGYVPTIQDAIDIAEAGDIVQVEDGTYTGTGNRDINFLGKAITVRGNVVDPNLVVIDCQGTSANPHCGFKFVSEEGVNSILEGFTITNGYGAISFSTSRGGGIYIINSSPSINKCIITNCDANQGAGIYCDGTNKPTIENCTIVGNSAVGNGGGIYGCHGTIANCTIRGNSATSFGGGVYWCDGTIMNCIVTGNSAVGGAGFSHCDGLVINCSVGENSGGGFYVCNGMIMNCTIIGNSESGLVACDATITDCIVSENFATTNGGGFHYCDGTIRNCTIIGNSAGGSGGGLAGCDGLIRNCTIIGNFAVANGGGFCWCSRIINCVVSGNSAFVGGGFSWCDGTIQNTIVWGNTADSYNQTYSSSVPNYSCIQDWTEGGLGNISDNPLFVDAASGDYHLSYDSPCINAGDPNYITDSNDLDMDGDPRVVGRLDMGVDEVYVNSSSAVFLGHRSLDFISEGIGGSVTPQTAEVFNFGAYDSSWTIVNDCEWLTVTPASGVTKSTETSEIAINIDSGYATYGVQSCQFQIVDPSAVNSPQVVTVTLDVLRPEMAISQNSFSFAAESIINPPEEQVLAISNTGYDTLNWTITGADTCGWLTMSSESGQTGSGASTDVSLSVDPAMAGYGSHSCELTISDSNASNSPQVVTVTLDVLRPEIAVAPSAFNFEYDIDDPNVFSHTLTIVNGGYDVLNWQVNEDCDWLSVSPVSGTCAADPNEVILTVNTAGLDIGYYNCEFTITDGNASNSPVVVPVSLHVYRNGERHVPTEYSTIQAAVDAAVDGDHIVIHPGRYGEYLRILDKQLTIRSVNPNDPAFVHSTIIERGMFTNQVPIINPLLIEGLSFIYNFVYGTQYHGTSGLYFWDTTAQIRNCIFKNWPQAGIVCHGFYGNLLIENCLFEGNRLGGVYLPFRTDNAIVEINHCTIVDSLPAYPGDYNYPSGIAGIRMDGYNNNQLIVRNSILSNYVSEGDSEINFGSAYSGEMNYASISNCCIPAGSSSITIFDPNYVEVTWGPGNIESEPLFVAHGYLDDNGTPDYFYDDTWFDGDYHLKSTAGRFVWDGFARADFNWDKRVDLIDFSMIAQYWNMSVYGYPDMRHLDMDGGNMVINEVELLAFVEDYLQPRVFGAWVADDVTSPCIDAGDLNDTGWQNELWPHGGRINMGAYGGTAQASMSPNDIGNPADLNHDNSVDLADWSLWADDWMAERTLLNSDFDRDNTVDANDITVFMENWLWRQ